MSARAYDVPPLNELRFELEKNEEISVTLLTGSAEIFGYELALNVEYPFGNECRGAVFTFEGARLEGICSTEYVAQESPVATYLNLHFALERQRLRARSQVYAKSSVEEDREAYEDVDKRDQYGQDDDFDMVVKAIDSPRVLIVGEKCSGKTTLAKSLINWAIRSGRVRNELANDTSAEVAGEEGEGKGRGVLLVNLDVGHGGFTIPGTIAMAPVYSPSATSTPAHTFGTTYATGQPPTSNLSVDSIKPNVYTQAQPLNALAFFYGHTSWSRNESHLNDVLVPRMASLAKSKLEEGDEEGLWRGGMIIDAPSDLADRSKSAQLQKVVREFGVNVLLVLGSEKLNIEMRRSMATNRSVTVIRLPKNEGVSEMESQYRRRIQAMQIHSYFYGGPPLSYGTLSPHSISVGFAFLTVYRLGEEVHAPSSALPLGTTRTLKDIELVEIDPSVPENTPKLLNRILALLQADDGADENGKVSSPALGFVHLAAVDISRKKFTILSPVAGYLPRRAAIVGTMEWQDA